MYAHTINPNLLELLHVLREIHGILAKAVEIKSPKNLNDEWLHTDDVARIFKKTERTIYTWRKNKLISFKKIKGTVYYLKSDIYNLLNK